eukprot:CAMPEP_0204117874 /NCGR_PEP_ID=MMETSP0361-20130328/6229_1 /ASSEMBLY_ACC=CAM_ASM_000343 /TAXON_ID=268821 /ORGANISM="Scrippsiella Hangoei, Strain SHTV-5" /LENGTH=61 /DNA_ID=CAMNT_0051068829 /DNA_START=347 /DNA_END=534 /DNA_ORIENTATION=-
MPPLKRLGGPIVTPGNGLENHRRAKGREDPIGEDEVRALFDQPLGFRAVGRRGTLEGVAPH